MRRQRESEGTTLESWDMTHSSTIPDKTVSTTFPEEVFECTSCNRKFSSFQALCGHRASHKRVKVEEKEKHLKPGARSEPKMHKCFICGEGFSLRQALRGHMRRHRHRTVNEVVAKVSTMKRSCNAKVFCLDLNLTPLENDLNLLLFGKVSPKVKSSSF